MSACDSCPKPGACCKDFALNTGPFPKSNWEDAAKEKMELYGLPFIPLRLAVTGRETAGYPAEVDDRVMVRFTCPKLTPEGRCGDYENRPETCRVYEPMQDDLCALYVEPAAEALP